MPVNSIHPDYDAALPAWLRARDVFGGEDAVKNAGERYLPKLDVQNDDEYTAYKSRAAFFNATGRTADGFVGLIFRREPKLTVPNNGKAVARALAAFAKDADLLGTALPEYAKNVMTEIIGVGRAGTLVDWEDQAEQRAYTVLYTAEQIINWRSERINGRNVVTLVVLSENADGRMKNEESDEFARETIEQIRVLKLVNVVSGEATDTTREARVIPMRYVVEVWQRKTNATKQTEWELIDARIPLRLGKPLPLIPFVFHGPRHALPDVDKLPLADIIAVNLDHYRLTAEFRHGLHFTALPTAWVSGFPKNSTLQIGSSVAWVTDTVGATAGFLEFTGQGLTTFERAMDRDERLMAVLGTRMLEAQKRVGETADAIELRQSGENSVLTTMSVSVGDSLTRVLRWVYWWNSTEDIPDSIGKNVVSIELNTDYNTKGMSSNELTAVVAAWQAGAISRETMFEILQRGEVLFDGRTCAQEARLAEGEHRTPAATVREHGGSNIELPTSNGNALTTDGHGSTRILK
jgi:hypothetical protein